MSESLGNVGEFVRMTFVPASASTADLFSTYRAILRELRQRTIVRTGNAPTGDYAEWLVARFLGGEPAPNSEKSFDVTGPDGRTYQVKSRMVDGAGQGKRQLSPFRSSMMLSSSCSMTTTP